MGHRFAFLKLCFRWRVYLSAPSQYPVVLIFLDSVSQCGCCSDEVEGIVWILLGHESQERRSNAYSLIRRQNNESVDSFDALHHRCVEYSSMADECISIHKAHILRRGYVHIGIQIVILPKYVPHPFFRAVSHSIYVNSDRGVTICSPYPKKRFSSVS